MPSDNETLISVRNVSKKFCRSLKKSLWYGLQDMGREIVGGRSDDSLTASDSRVHAPELRPGEFWAVNDVSFELKRGECLGLIGHNGAGKTTLLKMINGLIKPDHGSITMRGRVGALIALGAGFNPILTGRENIYVNGSVLGLTKAEIDVQVDAIIEFADIGDFIDTPVQNYSSGMAVRLGFAVAAVLIKPDILILDEVLAVGDIAFVIKCLSAVRRISANSAVVFVSHNMQYVSSFCSRVIMMSHGCVMMDTQTPADAIDKYFELVKNEVSKAGTGEANIVAIRIANQVEMGGSPRIEQGCVADLLLEFEISGDAQDAILSVYIMDESMSPLMCFPVMHASGDQYRFGRGRHSIQLSLGKLELNAGKYNFTVAIADPQRRVTLNRTQGLNEFRVYAEKTNWARVVRPVLPIVQEDKFIP